MTNDADPGPWIDALAGSHDRICELVGEMDAEDLRRPSYCDGWSLAQVLAHLGSGAEIFKGALDAVIAGEPVPGNESFPAIWERWSAMSTEEKAEAFMATDGQLVETLENLGDRLEELKFSLFGGAVQTDGAGFVAMRLNEHALHTWDVAVALDPSAVVDPDAAALLIDRLPQSAHWAGHPGAAADPTPFSVVVRTSEPVRVFEITVGDEVRMEPAAARSGAVADLELPAEALVRLVYGRLDPAHTPPGAESRALDRLRAVFTGV